MTAAPDDGLIVHLLDLFKPMDGVRARRMFGGHGVFKNGLMFAIVVDDVLYLKADSRTKPAFKARGLPPFVYRSRGKDVALSYHRAPEECLDDSAALCAWSEDAYGAALRARKRKTR